MRPSHPLACWIAGLLCLCASTGTFANPSVLPDSLWERIPDKQSTSANPLYLELIMAGWSAVMARNALEYMHQLDRKLRTRREAVEIHVLEKRLDAMATVVVDNQLNTLAESIRTQQHSLRLHQIRVYQITEELLGQPTKFPLRDVKVRETLKRLPRPENLSSSLRAQVADFETNWELQRIEASYSTAADAFKIAEERTHNTSQLVDMAYERYKVGLISDNALITYLLDDLQAQLAQDKSVLVLIQRAQELAAARGLPPALWYGA